MDSGRGDNNIRDSTTRKIQSGLQAMKINNSSISVVEDYQGNPAEPKQLMASRARPPEPRYGLPPKTRSIKKFNTSASSKNPQRSFHEIDIVCKNSWSLEALSYVPDFDRKFKADTYLLIRQSELWYLLYMDESKHVSMIDINKIESLAGIINGKMPEKLSKDDLTSIRKALSGYRVNTQKKKLLNIFTRYFFKHSKVINSEMTWLEAVFCGYYELIAPYHVTSTKAVYNENGAYIGAASKEIPGFKTARKDPLREEDLRITALESGYLTIEELDLIDKIVREDEAREKGIKLEMRQEPITGKIIPLHGDKTPKEIKLSVKDLINYRIVKGLGIGLTASRANNEDDCHTGNISKFGVRIDFDMSWWNIVYRFKPSGIGDWIFRYPNDNNFIVTEYDIRHFPNLRDARPFYWPTNPAPYIPEAVLNTFVRIFPISQNAFTAQENLLYQKLETHPVFVYHKFKTLLKYILTDAEMYRNIFKLHAPEDARFEGKYIIDMLSEAQAKQIKAFRDILTNMPEFHEFLEKHGETALKSITMEFSERNAKFEEKIKKMEPELAAAAHNKEKFVEKFAVKRLYREQCISLSQIRRTYDAILKETREKTAKRTNAASDAAASLAVSMKAK